jgi:hypothetical protein
MAWQGVNAARAGKGQWEKASLLLLPTKQAHRNHELKNTTQYNTLYP